MNKEGKVKFEKLIYENGGYLHSDKVMHHLGLSEAELSFKLKNKEILAYEDDNELHFPLFQFQDGQVIHRFSEILKELNVTPLSCIRFFLTPMLDTGINPITTLKNGIDIEYIKSKARIFNMHGTS